MSAKTTSARRAGARNVAAITLLMFVGLFMLLTWRMQAGQDPAIGNQVAQATTPPVVRHRLIVKRKVVTLIDNRPSGSSAASGSGSGSSSSGTGGGYASGGGSGAAPAPAPAPAYTPAPAPAPAPPPATSAS